MGTIETAKIFRAGFLAALTLLPLAPASCSQQEKREVPAPQSDVFSTGSYRTIGTLNIVDCNYIEGWIYNPKKQSSILVKIKDGELIRMDGGSFSKGPWTIFNYIFPDYFKDGRPHDIAAFRSSVRSGKEVLEELDYSPRTVACPKD